MINHRIQSVKIIHIFIRSIHIKTGIIFPSVENHITCLEKATSVRNIGSKRIIYISEFVTQARDRSLIKRDINSIGGTIMSCKRGIYS